MVLRSGYDMDKPGSHIAATPRVSPPREVQAFGALSINRIERRVLCGDEEVHLTPSEYRLLSTLAAQPHRAFSSRELLEAMWESAWRSDTSPLQIHVSRLRKKLSAAGAERNCLITVHGFGYRFEPGYEGHISRPQPTENRMAAERWHPASPVYLLASLDRQILWVGANVESYLGWQPADVVGRAIYSMIHPDDIVLAFEVRAELELGNPTTFVLRISAADGGFTAAHCRVNPIKDGQGITQLFLVEWLPSERPSDAGDISYASSRTDREPSVLPPEGMIQLFFDGDLILQDVRPHEPFLGYDPDDIIGAYFTPTGNSREQDMHMINALLSSGERSVDLQTLLFDASGRSHLLPVTSRLLVGDGETFLGLHSTIHLSDGGAAPADSS